MRRQRRAGYNAWNAGAAFKVLENHAELRSERTPGYKRGWRTQNRVSYDHALIGHPNVNGEK
jgi:hypothetical protein